MPIRFVLKALHAVLKRPCIPTSDKSFVNGTWNALYVGTNKLRDVEDKFLVEGQAFEFNHSQHAYDVCGPCEAHAILLESTKELLGGYSASEEVEQR